MSRARARAEREKAWLVIAMAWAAGCVDAIGYLSLDRLFTAHMSGNSAAMGAHLGQGDWISALHRAFPIPLFVVGIAVGAALTEVATRRGDRSRYCLALGLEALLLLVFMAGGNGVMRGGALRTAPWKFYALASLPALAMGLQNATLRRVGGHGVRTTYVSGMLTNFGEQAVTYLFWLRDHTRGGPRHRIWKVLRVSLRQESMRQVLLYGGIWSAFCAGAVLGGYSEQRWDLLSLAFPLCGLTAIAVIDLIQPIEPSPGMEKGRR